MLVIYGSGISVVSQLVCVELEKGEGGLLLFFRDIPFPELAYDKIKSIRY